MHPPAKGAWPFAPHAYLDWVGKPSRGPRQLVLCVGSAAELYMWITYFGTGLESNMTDTRATPDQARLAADRAHSWLSGAGLRPTRQRKELGRLLFDGPDRHVTAEVLHDEAMRAGVRVSLATVYNTLNQFTEAGLMREIVVDGDRTYFDTNTSDHHHFFHRHD